MTTTFDDYQKVAAATSQAMVEQRIYNLFEDYARHEKRLDKYEGDITGLLRAVSGLESGVRWLTWSVAGLFGIFLLAFLFSIAMMAIVFAPAIGRLF